MKAYKSSRCLLLAIGLLLAACNRSNLAGAPSAVTPTSSATSTPVSSQDLEASFSGCRAPCWAGIEVGSTDGERAKQLLANRYSQDTITAENYLGRYTLDWSLNPADVSRSGRVGVLANTVNFVVLQFDAGAVIVERLVDAIGEPGFVNVSSTTDPPDSCAEITLIYPDSGITVYLLPVGDSKGVLENQPVDSINFSDTGENAEFWKWVDTVTLDWDGYQDYCAGR